MVELVKNNIDKIGEACKNHQVKALYLFGSGARSSDFTENSDLDFLVEYDFPDETNDLNVFARVENTESLKGTLEIITARDVDLLQEKNIRNKFLKYFINKEKLLVYGIS